MFIFALWNLLMEDKFGTLNLWNKTLACTSVSILEEKEAAFQSICILHHTSESASCCSFFRRATLVTSSQQRFKPLQLLQESSPVKAHDRQAVQRILNAPASNGNSPVAVPDASVTEDPEGKNIVKHCNEAYQANLVQILTDTENKQSLEC